MKITTILPIFCKPLLGCQKKAKCRGAKAKNPSCLSIWLFPIILQVQGSRGRLRQGPVKAESLFNSECAETDLPAESKFFSQPPLRLHALSLTAKPASGLRIHFPCVPRSFLCSVCSSPQQRSHRGALDGRAAGETQNFKNRLQAAFPSSEQVSDKPYRAVTP